VPVHSYRATGLSRCWSDARSCQIVSRLDGSVDVAHLFDQSTHLQGFLAGAVLNCAAMRPSGNLAEEGVRAGTSRKIRFGRSPCRGLVDVKSARWTMCGQG
jgi:hypothetical protein